MSRVITTTETSAAPPPPSFHVPEGAKDGAPAASSPPEATVGIAHGATAAAAPAADTGIDADTDLIPAVVAPTPPSTGIHASRRIRRSGTVHTGQAAKPNAWSFTPLRTAKPLTTQRARGGANAKGDDREGA